ncbi:MAG: four helix bundle protein [Bacilli bacterium]|jgi:D-ribose pyranose/furanose isomerase RbsD|nr:four helix bundle protein [Bacilli bacterium]
MNHRVKEKDSDKTVEDLIIYKQFIELIYYTENILMKYPKCERFALASTIKNTTYEGMRYVLNTFKEYSKEQKISNLNHLDTTLKMIKVMIRVSYKKKYINAKNYAAWGKKLANLGNLLGGWMKSCLKQ